MKKYKITLPTPEQCIAFGLKYEGLAIRTQLWLMGVASGVAFMNRPEKFNMMLSGRTNFIVETNSVVLINQVEEYLSHQCITVVPIVPLGSLTLVPK